MRRKGRGLDPDATAVSLLPWPGGWAHAATLMKPHLWMNTSPLRLGVNVELRKNRPARDFVQSAPPAVAVYPAVHLFVAKQK